MAKIAVRNYLRYLCSVKIPCLLLILGLNTAHSQAQDTSKANIVFLGDSLTAGFGVDESEAYPALVGEKLKEYGLNDFRIINAGISGDTTSGGLRRINWLLREPVDLLVLALGANDGLRGLPLKASKANLISIIEKVRAVNPKTKIIVAGMLIPPNMGQKYTEEFKQMFSKVAKEMGTELIPFLLEGVAADPQFNLADGIHPNAEGYRIVAENVWKYLHPSLEKISTAKSNGGNKFEEQKR